MKDFRLFSFVGRIFGLTLASLCVGLLWFIPSSLAATYIVDTAADAQDGECVVDTTFSEAINCANANPGADTINFSIGTVNLVSNPPAMTEAVDMDGNGTVTISAASSVTWAVTASGAASNVTIRGLTITGFSQCGISIIASNITVGGTDATDRNVIYSPEGAVGVCIRGSNNTVINNYIGVEADGVTPGSLIAGISFDGFGTGNVVGGDASNERNVISGNTQYGIRFWEGDAGATVLGNYIGLDAGGTVAVPNGIGVFFTNDTYPNAVQIGGTTAGERNIISGNTNYGISISGTHQNTKIIGNYIGTNVVGTAALANGQSGIRFDNGACSAVGNCLIGGTASGEGNVISGNTNYGIETAGGTPASLWQITANYIGTNAAGNAAVPNNIGIYLAGGGTSVVIGKNDTSATNYNVISGNTITGLKVQNFSGSSTISSNYIGLNAAGTAAIPNGEHGISILNLNAAGVVTLGSSTATSPTNVISGNMGNGIYIETSDGSVSVYSSILGLSAAQDADLGNNHGIYCLNGTGEATIGNTLTQGFNVIAGNGVHGIWISDASSEITGNYVGVNSALTTVLKNDSSGIYVSGGAAVIGGTESGQGNIITGHTAGFADQINLGSDADGVQILGNYIGMDTDGDVLGSGTDGIYVQGTNTVIGSSVSGGRNYIGNMTGDGIELSAAEGTTVVNTYIGVKPDGVSNIGNGGSGILIAGGTNNVIGYDYDETVGAEKRNLIQFNITAQIKVDGTGVGDNMTIRGNYLGTTNPTTFVNSPNNGVSLVGTSITTSSTSRFAITTGFADGSKVDIFSVTGAGVITYEGTATVASGTAQLDKDFTAIGGDNYFFQITEADGDSTVVSGSSLVNPDSSAPSALTVTSSVSATNVAAYTFTGTKDVYSSVWYGDTQRVAVDSSTAWTYAVTLAEGANAFSFTSKDYSSNESEATAVSITLDTIVPSVSSITSAISYSGTGSTYSATITGTKEAGSSVKNNDTEIVAANDSTTWSYISTLAVGSNTYSFVVTDAVGNPSGATAHTITYTQLAATTDNSGTVGGGSGSNGYESNHYSDTLIDEEEEGEEEEAGEEIVEPVEEDIPMEILDPAEASEDQFGTQVGTEESFNQMDASDFAEEVEQLYPVSDVYVLPSVSFGEVQPQAMVLPETAVTREDVFIQPVLQGEMGDIESDEDSDTVPDWWEQANFNTMFVNKTADSDNDGVTDSMEWMNGTNPVSADSDADGVEDGVEITFGLNPGNWDSDEDGLSDVREIELGTNPLSADSDEDGVIDNIEVGAGSNPLNVKNAPVITMIGGVPDQWLKDYGLDDVLYGQPAFVSELNVNVERTLAWDTDKDGLSDRDELNYGTNPLEADSDDDGVSDGAEVHVYQTDPNVMTRSGQLFQTRISSLKSSVRNTYMDGYPLIAGTSKPDTHVQISFVLLKGNAASTGVQQSLLQRLSHLLLANLFGEVENTGDTMTLETQTGGHGKFLVRPEDELSAGRYAVVVRSFDAEGNITSETLPYDLTIDPTAAMSLVDPKQLDTQLIDVANLEVFKIQNSQPYLYGVAEKGYEVVTSWESELFTSSLVVDTTKGEFLTASPSELEQGDHNVFVYAVEPSKNLYSSVIDVGFQVVGAGALYSSAEEGHASPFVIFGLGGVLLILGLGFVAYKNTHEAKRSAL
ncbi:MAG: hypothetical protein WCW30_03205 [Candidatus Gracilibacteria bacterium]